MYFNLKKKKKKKKKVKERILQLSEGKKFSGLVGV